MNAEHINPFVQGAQNILSMVCGETTSLGKLGTRKQPYQSEEVAIKIGIVGQITGSVVFTMKNELACYIASKMMMGMPVEQLDDMSISAISELTNMISGNVATLFSSNEVLIDITPPQFMKTPTVADFSFIPNNTLIVCIPLQFGNNYVFEIHIALNN